MKKEDNIEILLSIMLDIMLKQTNMRQSNTSNIILTEQDIQNIINSLPNLPLSDETYLEKSEIFGIKEIIPNLIRYVVAPVLVATMFLIFLMHYFQNSVSKSIETTFILYQPKAKTVQIAGDFTKWEAVDLTNRNGMWEIKLNLKPGEYKYIYIIDGIPTLDPQREIYEDTFGNKNSVIYI